MIDYSTKDNIIYVKPSPYFDIAETLECGQVFRFEKEDEAYIVHSGAEQARVTVCSDGTRIECTDVDYFVRYFDLDTDYAAICEDITVKLDRMSDSGCYVNKDLVSRAIERGRGIRILRQNEYEMLISFIVSANNNIPRIKKILNLLCEPYAGVFPTPCQMAERSVEYYRSLGTGYRDRYLFDTSCEVASGAFDTHAIHAMDTPTARRELCRLRGVGEKVAECILLFGYHHTDLFPVDVWMERAFYAVFGEGITDRHRMRDYVVAHMTDSAGYLQQYLYNYFMQGLVSE